MDIAEVIPTGCENAVKRDELERLTGERDRDNRRMIASASELIINTGNGYFKPGDGDELLVRRCYMREIARKRSIDKRIALMSVWLSARSGIPGQMSLSQLLGR